MVRTVDDRKPSRSHPLVSGSAGVLEVAAVATGAVLVWAAALGEHWPAVPASPGGSQPVPGPGVGWILLHVVAMLAVGWLALRGRAVPGVVAVCVPVVICAGWRLAGAGVVTWPTEVAALVFTLSATCMATAAVCSWLRRAC